MTLFTAYILVASVFCILGLVALIAGQKLAPALLAFPRAQMFGNILWGGALAWFLYHLNTIAEVDLAGFPRIALFVLFGGAGVFAFKYLQDLLPLRAIAVLVLFSCNELLKAGFNQVPYSTVLAGTAYILIIPALWTGAAPYNLRNWITKICESGKRIRIAGTVFLLVGITNIVALSFVK